MDYQQLLKTLLQNATTKYQQFSQKIVNTSTEIIGCKLPFLRKLAKQCNYTPSQVLQLPTNQYFELDMLKGIVISKSQLPFAEKFQLLNKFTTTIDNWSVCDSCVVKVNSQEESQYFDYFSLLLHSDKPFICRYGIVNLICNYLDDAHILKVFNLLDTVKVKNHYYVDMAVAWLISVAMVNCRKQTIDFMQNKGKQVLSKFTYNKALQKIRESFRISEQDKQWTYLLTIK